LSPVFPARQEDGAEPARGAKLRNGARLTLVSELEKLRKLGNDQSEIATIPANRRDGSHEDQAGPPLFDNTGRKRKAG
jgi:hypothetical protein